MAERLPVKQDVAGSNPAGPAIWGYSSTGRAAVSKTACWVFKSLYPCHIGASPSGKAADSDSAIRWFKSSRPSHNIWRVNPGGLGTAC